MYQKGFLNIILLIVVVVALASAGTYFVVTQTIIPSTPTPTFLLVPNLSPTSTTNPNSNSILTSAQFPPSGNTVSVYELNRNKENFVGRNVRVTGKIHVDVFFGAMPCKDSDPVCDTSMGAQLELLNNEKVLSIDNLILLFKDNKSYPCNKIASATYKCGPYTSKNDESVVLRGLWTKDQIAIQSIGISGGNPPTPIKWADRYFLNIK